MMKKLLNTLILIGWLSGGAWLAACSSSDQPANNRRGGPTPVKVAQVTKQSVSFYDQYPARVMPLQEVTLRAQVSGYVTGIHFDEGRPVTKGQKLYSIDPRKSQATYQEAQASLRTAQANLTQSEKDAARYRALDEKQAIARQTLDDALTTLKADRQQVASAQAALRSASTDVGYNTITAPFDGLIGISQVRLGDQVSPGSTILNTLSAQNPVGTDFEISQEDLARFQRLSDTPTDELDSTFRLVLPGGQEYSHFGKVYALDRAVASQTGTVTVRLQFPNPDETLKAGMNGTVEVRNQLSGEQLLVPNKSIKEQMGEFFVFVVQDTIVRETKVTTGQQVRDQIVVEKGLQEGEQVVTEGTKNLRDSSRVQVGPPNAPPDAQAQNAAQ